MATMIKSYEVESYKRVKLLAFVLFEYETMEATASIEYNGCKTVRAFKAKEGLEYEALRKAAYQAADKAIMPRSWRSSMYGIMEGMSAEVAVQVEAYLYAD